MYELGHVHAKNIDPFIIKRTRTGEKEDPEDVPFYMLQEIRVAGTDDKEGYEKIMKAVKEFLEKQQ